MQQGERQKESRAIQEKGREALFVLQRQLPINTRLLFSSLTCIVVVRVDGGGGCYEKDEGEETNEEAGVTEKLKEAQLTSMQMWTRAYSFHPYPLCPHTPLSSYILGFGPTPPNSTLRPFAPPHSLPLPPSVPARYFALLRPLSVYKTVQFPVPLRGLAFANNFYGIYWKFIRVNINSTVGLESQRVFVLLAPKF
ncbi:hypothetical protein KQX54_019219 [Cotesia glomerata]|uniref:Uncharacterized protein n=1 Tax=Cotesia glomerata TaxID=32391 RepID=A0AAV7J018_COTGL|nr:hypothetical protein KQX54_019219 [Cotesia glomerata]